MGIVRLILISAFLVVGGGTSLAIARPDNVTAAPFKGIAIAVLETSSMVVSLMKGTHVNTRAVAATNEHKVVSAALQSMMAREKLVKISPVKVATNNMSSFPSAEHPLFPGYLQKRFSEFKYTVDENGIVDVDHSDATTDPLLAKIDQILSQLKGRETLEIPVP